MSPVAVCGGESPIARAIAIFCVFWPVVTFGLLPTRGRSSAPLAAMLLPFAMATCGTWVALIRVVQTMAISGGGRGATAAGVAEALMMLVAGACSAGAVALAALLRRHRPVADRGVLVLTALAIANAVAAMIFAPTMPAAAAGALTALSIAIAALVWLIAVMKTLVTPHPLPRSAFVVFASIVLVALAAWQRVETFAHIAKYGQ